MFTAQQLIDLQNIFDQNPDLELIEIWNNRLYLRPVAGRCKIASMPESLKNDSSLIGKIYINLKNKGSNDYVRQLLFKFHPDLSKSKCASEITQNLFEWRRILDRCNEGSESANLFNTIVQLITDYTSLSVASFGVSFEKWLQDRHSNGYDRIIFTEDKSRESTNPATVAMRKRARQIYDEQCAHIKKGHVDNRGGKP